MPIYEYECSKCGRTSEVMQKFSDAPLVECCECHGHLRKLVSMSTFHLKGSGWYTTDYAGKNQSSCQAAKAESPTDKSEAKTESKVETKSTG